MADGFLDDRKDCPRCGNPLSPPRSPLRDRPGDFLADAHKAGVERHGVLWLDANQAAISAADECGIDFTTFENSALLSLVTLRVLDAAKTRVPAQDRLIQEPKP